MKDKDTQLIWEAYGSDDRVSTGLGQETHNPAVIEDLMDTSKRKLEKGEVWEGSEYLHVSEPGDEVAQALKELPDISEYGVFIITYHVKTPDDEYVGNQEVYFVIDDRMASARDNIIHEFLGAIVLDGNTLEVDQVLTPEQAEALAEVHKLYIEEQLPEPELEPDYEPRPNIYIDHR